MVVKKKSRSRATSKRVKASRKGVQAKTQGTKSKNKQGRRKTPTSQPPRTESQVLPYRSADDQTVAFFDSETQATLAALVESSDDAIIGERLDGTVVAWNPSAESIYGYTADEMIGQSIALLSPPDQPDEILGILKRLVQGEKIDHFETVRRTKEGRIINVSLSISPIRDASGTIIGASTIARDITQRKQAEQRLRESSERYRTLVETVPHGIERLIRRE